MSDVKTFKVSERCQDCGAFKREHIGFALVCPPLPESRPVPDQRDVREPQGAPPCCAIVEPGDGESVFCERPLGHAGKHESPQGAPPEGPDAKP